MVEGVSGGGLRRSREGRRNGKNSQSIRHLSMKVKMVWLGQHRKWKEGTNSVGMPEGKILRRGKIQVMGDGGVRASSYLIIIMNIIIILALLVLL